MSTTNDYRCVRELGALGAHPIPLRDGGRARLMRDAVVGLERFGAWRRIPTGVVVDVLVVRGVDDELAGEDMVRVCWDGTTWEQWRYDLQSIE